MPVCPNSEIRTSDCVLNEAKNLINRKQRLAIRLFANLVYFAFNRNDHRGLASTTESVIGITSMAADALP